LSCAATSALQNNISKIYLFSFELFSPFQTNENFIGLQTRFTSFSVYNLIHWANVKYALLEMIHDQVLKNHLNITTAEKFWSKLYVDQELSQFKELATIALLIFLNFPTTV
jgi:hypothetical protein